MCGIAGTVDLRPGLGSVEDLVADMTDALAHRGPDDAGLYVEPPVALGNRRLAILDLSPAGHQPMASRDGRVWLTYNGEIYNYKELAKELRERDHQFIGLGDTEVLLHAYLEWGVDCLSRLNGMFAFAIWDRHTQELFCARDRLGVKPFYYTIAGGRLRFASEIKALLIDREVRREANDLRVYDFLAHGLADHTRETMFAGIYQLPAGSFMRVSATQGVGEPTDWYRLQPAELEGMSTDDLRDLLTDAVSLRLRSDVPVGALLSGGLDSSSVVAIASLVRGASGADPPESFTARSHDPNLDEGRYAETVLARTGSRNHEFFPDERRLLEELDLMLWYAEEPPQAASYYAHWKLMELMRKAGIKVILDGSGGDEAFLGYHFLLYPSVYFSLLRQGRPDVAIRELAWRRTVNGVSLRQTASGALRFVLPTRLRAFRRPSWIHPAFPIPPRPLPSRTLRGHQLFGLTVSPLPLYNRQNDRSSMSFSLELRNPFLDYRVIEYGLALESRDLLRNGLSKWPLRSAMRDILPPAVVDRSDKQGFSTDEAEWMRHGALGVEMERVFRSKSLSNRPYFRSQGLLETLSAHRAGQQLSFSLWRAFVVERWLELFVDPPTLRSPTTLRPSMQARDRLVVAKG